MKSKSASRYKSGNIGKATPAIFGSLDWAPLPVGNEAPKNKRVYGAWVATHEFYTALFQYGTFDEYHFFTDGDPGLFQKRFSRWFTRNKKVRFKRIEDLPGSLQNTRYTVFFTCSPYLDKLAYLRRQYARHYFPICGLAYTISYQHLLRDIIFGNLLAGLYPSSLSLS